MEETDEKKVFHKQYFLLFGKLVITLEFRHIHTYTTVIEVMSLAQTNLMNIEKYLLSKFIIWIFSMHVRRL
ncbi:MAG: hypothetical protein PUF34_08175 [Sharpea azabuensis]|nr:hypothetical protein [Sharpea azabuensis]